MTWNVRGAARPDLARIAEVVREQRADAVAFQEIRLHQARALASALGWQQVWTRKHSPFTPLLWWLAEGLSIMSPHGLGGATHRTLTPGVTTWSHRHRVVLAATVSRADASLRLYDIHLSPGARHDDRIGQAVRVATMMADEHPQTAVVAGDFNAPGEVEVVRAMHGVGVRDPGGGPTHPSMRPRQRLDLILLPESANVSGRFEPDGGDAWRELSDHVPVLLEFMTNM